MQPGQTQTALAQSKATDNSIVSPKEKSGASSNKRGDGFYFAGFKSPNYTPIPDEFFDVLAPQLSEAELRVLLYIMRRTFGFKKQADAISLSQLTGGIRKRNGEVQDSGTGLSKPAALKGVAGLQEKGIIVVEKSVADDGRNEVNVYRLRYANELAINAKKPEVFQQEGYSNIEYSRLEQTDFPSPDLRLASSPPMSSAISAKEVTERQGRRRVGETPVPVVVNEIDQEQINSFDNSRVNQNYPGSKVTLPPVNEANPRGKADLPIPALEMIDSKTTLPRMVQLVNQGSKTARSEGVKQIDQQHGSLQKSSYQETISNKTPLPYRAGNLAIQVQEDVVVDITKNNSLNQAQEEIERLLLGYGLNRKTASELVANWSVEYIKEKIRLVESLRRRNPAAVRNLPGFIRQAITEDYQPTQNNSSLQNPARPATSRYRRVSGPGLVSTPTGKKSFQELARNRAELSSMYEETISRKLLLDNCETGRNFTAKDYSLLWERVCQAIAERFRRPDVANKLIGSNLEITVEGRCASIKLAQPWRINALLSGERALLQMAFSQEIGPGYTLEISEG